MYNLAGEFEEVCRGRLKVARAQVPGPKGTTIKLNLSAGAGQSQGKNPTIKLKLGGKGKASPSPAPAGGERGSERGTPGIVVDGDALQRQRDMVSGAVNGGRPASSTGGARNPFGGTTSRSQSATTPIPTLARGASAARASPAPLAQTNGAGGVKAEGQSPALSAIRPSSQAPLSMPPPAGVASRPVSGSPHPQAQSNGTALAVQPPVVQQPWQPPPAANTFVQSKLREKGSSEFLPSYSSFLPVLIGNITDESFFFIGVKSSILPELRISSHPSLPGTPFTRTIRAHPRLIDQSVTYTVPASKHTFHIIPTLPPSVTSRAYRIFVSVDGRRISPKPEGERGRPVYEARLERGGVGRVEVEVLAEKERSGLALAAREGGEDEEKGVGKKEEMVERERVVVYVHVMRN